MQGNEIPFELEYENVRKRKVAREAIRRLGSTRTEPHPIKFMQRKVAAIRGRLDKRISRRGTEMNCFTQGHSPDWNEYMEVYVCFGCDRITDHPESLNTLPYRLVWGLSELTGISLGRLAPWIFGKAIGREANPYTPRKTK